MTTAESAAGAPAPGIDGLALDLPEGGLLGAIVRLDLAVSQVLEEHAARADLTFADYLVLGVVRRSPGQRSAPTAIASTLDRTTGGMSLALDRLEAAGLVRRTRDGRDGRRVVVELTPRGRRLSTAVNSSLHEWEAGLGLPVPASSVVTILDDLTAAIPHDFDLRRASRGPPHAAGGDDVSRRRCVKRLPLLGRVGHLAFAAVTRPMPDRSLRSTALAMLVVSLVLLAACGSSGAKTTEAAGEGGESGGSADTTAPEETTTTTPPGPPKTSCKEVVHIGDSTSLGLTSPSYLPQPLTRIDVQYIRVGVEAFRPEISGARSVVEHLKGQLNAEDVAEQIKATGYEGCWVLALGTTDAADISHGSSYDEDERIGKMMAVVGDDPVLWVNVKTLETEGNWRNENMQVFNQHLEAAKARYPNLHVYDWSSVVQDAWFTKDGIHYTTAGYVQRARLIADALAEQIPA